MRIGSVIIIVLLVIGGSGAGASPQKMDVDQIGQRPMSSGGASELFFGGIQFSYDVFNYISSDPGLSRLDVYVSFVYDVLQFYTDEENTFRSRYELSIAVEDRRNYAIDEKSSYGTVRVNTYEATNSRRDFVREQVSFELPPDKYTVVIRLIDTDTRKSLERKKEVRLREFARDKMHMSDILFADSLSHDSKNVQKLLANIQRTFDSPLSEMRAYYEIYPPVDAEYVRLYNEITDAQGEVVYSHLDTLENKGDVVKQVIDLRSLIKKPGRYELGVRASSEKQRATIVSRFFVQWSNVSLVESSLDLAIEQLKYIARKEDVAKIEEATEGEKEMMFNEFWRKRDPTPNTELNELKEEFFRRVDFANRNFTVLIANIDGWQTDRGKIYIKYGVPTDVQQESADISGPVYETWQYRNLNRIFVFADRDGSGNFVLIRSE